MTHPNKLSFFGKLCYIDMPSDKAPYGSRGRRVKVLKHCIEDALPTLVGMAVNYKNDYLDSHEPTNIAGIITEAVIVDEWLAVSGYLFAINHPKVIRMLRANPEKFGMSYEIHNAHVVNMRTTIWEIEKLTFTGASICVRSKCAYSNSSFELLEPLEMAATNVRS